MPSKPAIWHLREYNSAVTLCGQDGSALDAIVDTAEFGHAVRHKSILDLPQVEATSAMAALGYSPSSGANQSASPCVSCSSVVGTPERRSGRFSARTCSICDRKDVDICCTFESFEDGTTEDPRCVECCTPHVRPSPGVTYYPQG